MGGRQGSSNLSLAWGADRVLAIPASHGGQTGLGRAAWASPVWGQREGEGQSCAGKYGHPTMPVALLLFNTFFGMTRQSAAITHMLPSSYSDFNENHMSNTRQRGKLAGKPEAIQTIGC